MERLSLEVKVFTLPTCSTCPVAKNIASEVAKEFNVRYREISLATKEGWDEGLAYDIMSTPSIVIDEDVIVRGRLVSKERLSEEVKKRIEKWEERAYKEQPKSF